MKVVEDFRRSLGTMAGLFGVLVLHVVPGVLATRVRVAQTEEVLAWRRSRHASTSSSFRAGRSPVRLMGETGPPKSPGNNGHIS